MTTTGYLFLRFTHETFIKIGHMWGHKTSLNNLKEMKSYGICSLMIMELNQKSMTEITHGEHAAKETRYGPRLNLGKHQYGGTMGGALEKSQ